MSKRGQAVGKSVSATSVPGRRYDKGERRLKHVGRSATATIDDGNPKKKVGKCPNNIAQTQRELLLQNAIPAPGAPTAPYAKRLYLTHEGVIYECQTSDQGSTYHAYPYDGRMRRALVDALRALPDAMAHKVQFDEWVDEHINLVG